MPKAPGTSDPEWKAVEKLQVTFPSFIKWLSKYGPKALKILEETLDNPNAADHLRHGAATRTLDMYLKFSKEYKNAIPQDFVRKTPYEIEQERKAKEEKAGVTPISNKFLETEFIPEEDLDNGTER